MADDGTATLTTPSLPLSLPPSLPPFCLTDMVHLAPGRLSRLAEREPLTLDAADLFLLCRGEGKALRATGDQGLVWPHSVCDRLGPRCGTNEGVRLYFCPLLSCPSDAGSRATWWRVVSSRERERAWRERCSRTRPHHCSANPQRATRPLTVLSFNHHRRQDAGRIPRLEATCSPDGA